MKKPNFFIVGLDRAGTTAWHDFLGQHPQVFATEEKEPSYFCKDIHEETDKFFGMGQRYRYRTEKDYLALFKDAKNEKILMESSPIYLSSKVAAKEIKKFNPKAKIMIILREPVDYIYSSYWYSFVRGYETAKDFRTAILLEKDRKQGKNVPQKFSHPSGSIYAEKVHFYDQVKRFLDVFPKNQVKIIIYEDFKKNNLGTYQDVIQWLGIDPTFVPQFSLVNPTRSPTVHQKVNAVLFHNPFREALRQILPKKFYYDLKTFIKFRLLLKPDKKKRVDPDFRKFLMKRFKPEVEKVSTLIGKDLAKRWRYDTI